MAEDINGYFSSVFTRVPDAKFQKAKSDCLGQ